MPDKPVEKSERAEKSSDLSRAVSAFIGVLDEYFPMILSTTVKLRLPRALV